MHQRIYDGSAAPPPVRTPLRAGALTLDYENGMIRFVHVGGVEIVRGIYAAVRDHNWTTITPQLRDVEMDIRDDSFVITFTVDHVQDDLHFVWRGAITGTPENSIQFTFNGEALTSFRRNRVGFCVLHPHHVAGKPVAITHVDGQIENGAFPEHIAPHQPFFDIRAITTEPLPGMRVEVVMEGDAFEMEDQRNWTDASFKTYCTPLREPFPVMLQAGTNIQQSVTIRVTGDIPAQQAGDDVRTVHVDVARTTRPLPALSLCANADGAPLTARESEGLRRLRLTYVRADVRFGDGWEARLAQTWQIARALIPDDPVLEIALTLNGDARAQLESLAAVMTQHTMRACLLIFRDGSPVTPPADLETAFAVFDRFADPLIIGGGVDAYFTQLNRNRPLTQLDITAYSVNPQVHAYDNDTLIEGASMIGETINSARQFAPDSAIHVTPITLKIRWNPDATAPEPPMPHGQLPRQVDVRQMSLFGAGWVVAALKSLQDSTGDNATFFEMTGLSGIMARETDHGYGDLFPSIPGSVYPMYHIFADLGELPFLSGFAVHTSHEGCMTALGLRVDDKRRLLIASHTPYPQTITITGLNGMLYQKSLDKHSADHAMRDPEGWRALPGHPVHAHPDGFTIELLPYAVVRLDNFNGTETNT